MACTATWLEEAGATEAAGALCGEGPGAMPEAAGPEAVAAEVLVAADGWGVSVGMPEAGARICCSSLAAPSTRSASCVNRICRRCRAGQAWTEHMVEHRQSADQRTRCENAKSAFASAVGVLVRDMGCDLAIECLHSPY